LGKLLGPLLDGEVVEFAVEVGDVVRHVGLLQQLVLGLDDLARLIGVLRVALLILQLAGAELK
jgi:hypothetical protein